MGKETLVCIVWEASWDLVCTWWQTNIPLPSTTNQILVTLDTTSHFTNGALYKSYRKTYFYIRSSCTQEWFHAVVKYFYLPSNVVDVFKTGNWSSLANFLISKMIMRSRTMQNGPCCCPLLAHCISVIVSTVQTAMATWNRHTISPNGIKVTVSEVRCQVVVVQPLFTQLSIKSSQFISWVSYTYLWI